MRKKIFFFVVGPILILICIVIIMLWQSYASSPEYNYVTAKLDIKNGNSRIVNVVDSIIPPKEGGIQAIASKYGFKNVYLKKISPGEMNGINQYNETIEIYLNFRNGPNWKYNYQKEIDSLYRVS
ncbi:MAG: hypothetical protein ABIR78_05080, partial [Ferruginibacter sp.]